MALDFTNIKDQPGAAIYFINDGTSQGERKLKAVFDELSPLTDKQMVWIGDYRSRDAGKIIDFYDLKGTEFIIIVRDNDQLHHVWSNGERMDAGQISYVARRAG